MEKLIVKGVGFVGALVGAAVLLGGNVFLGVGLLVVGGALLLVE